MSTEENLIKIKILDQEVTLTEAKQIHQELSKIFQFIPKETDLYRSKEKIDMSKMSYN